VQVDEDALETAQADAPALGLSGDPSELVREGLRLLHQYAVDWKAAQADPERAAAEDQHAAS
jgi:Arc/MetJ-type ribon-helix-helix transcriptional regulator